jgi:hypothetical protein
MAIDFNKPVQTRNGEFVRVLCEDAGGEYPVVGLVGEQRELRTWTFDGVESIGTGFPHGRDLVNTPKPVIRWFNLYHGEAGMAFDTKDECVRAGERQMLCVVKVTFLDGKPISSELEDI